ncbi:PE family protein, partial [Mycobacterium asiaticum]|uniref:PE family protein n=1 Tax=Mycobacterium asiaticum TaxID=1790 RepID=UPI000B07816D
MSYLIAAPELISAAASNLAMLEAAIAAASTAVTAPTTAVLAAGGDEVSAAIAALFSTHGRVYQVLSAQAAAFHQQFVRALVAGVDSYIGADAAAARSLPAASLQETLMNLGLGNRGTMNLGGGNNGSGNVGNGNIGNRNFGGGNAGDGTYGEGGTRRRVAGEPPTCGSSCRS